MAKFETRLKGSFYPFLDHMEECILRSADSMNLVDSSTMILGDTQVAVRVYDKYFFRNGNRASLTLTVAGKGDDLRVSAIGAGGGSGIVFNFSLGAETAMVDVVKSAVEDYTQGKIRS